MVASQVSEMTCSLCANRLYARGWCKNHYARWHRTGDPHGVNRPPGLSMMEAFRWYMPGDPPESGCWEWSGGAFHVDGYGLIGHQGKLWRAHVMAYELFCGSVPDGQLVRHTCDNPPCVQPRHLLAGTCLDNMRDKVDRGRQPRGEQAPKAKLVADQVLEIRQFYSAGITQPELARTYGISQASISAIIRRVSWKHLGQDSPEMSLSLPSG